MTVRGCKSSDLHRQLLTVLDPVQSFVSGKPHVGAMRQLQIAAAHSASSMPRLRRAAAAHLAGRQIDDAGAIAALRPCAAARRRRSARHHRDARRSRADLPLQILAVRGSARVCREHRRGRIPATKPPTWANHATPPLRHVGIADGAHAAEDLDDKPVEQHEHGRDLHRREENEDRHQRDDPRMGEFDQVGAHHACDGAARAERGHARIRRRASREPAQRQCRRAGRTARYLPWPKTSSTLSP